jgi:hypothetical protein
LVVNPKEEGRLSEFEKRLLRVVSLFGCKRDEQIGDEKFT